MIKQLLAASALAAGALASQGASAASMLGEEPDAGVIVKRGDLEWVWAGPCAGLEPSCGVVKLHSGFQFANKAHWLYSFADAKDIYNAFHNPSKKCASTYFNVRFDHCDSGDLQRGYIWNSPHSLGGDGARNETFLVRKMKMDVPAPGAIGLLGLGLLGLGAARRRKAA